MIFSLLLVADRARQASPLLPVRYLELGRDDVVAFAVYSHFLCEHLHALAEPVGPGLRDVEPVDVSTHRNAIVEVDDGGDVRGLEAGYRLVHDGEGIDFAFVAEARLFERPGRAAVAAGRTGPEILRVAVLADHAPEVRRLVRVLLGQLHERDDWVRFLLSSGGCFLRQGATSFSDAFRMYHSLTRASSCWHRVPSSFILCSRHWCDWQ